MLSSRLHRIMCAIALGASVVIAPVAAQAQTAPPATAAPADNLEARFATALVRVVVAVAAKDNDLVERRIALLPDVDGGLPRLLGRWLFDFALNKPTLADSERALAAQLESRRNNPPMAALRAMKFFDRGISAQDIRELSGGGANAPKTDDLIIARIAHGLVEAYRGKDGVTAAMLKDVTTLAAADTTSQFRDLASPDAQIALIFAAELLRNGWKPLPNVIPIPRDYEGRSEAVLLLDLLDDTPAVADAGRARIARSIGFGACVAANMLLVSKGPQASNPIFEALAERQKTLEGEDAIFAAVCAANRAR